MKNNLIKTHEKVPVNGDTFCVCCGEQYEVSLLVPPSGNRRRFKRHYHCEACDNVFCKRDFAHAINFLFSPTQIFTFLFQSPRTRMRLSGQIAPSRPTVRGQFRQISLQDKNRARQKRIAGPVSSYATFSNKPSVLDRMLNQVPQHLV